MLNINPRRLLTIAGLISMALVYTLLWARMINDPKQRTGSDFIGFYSLGRIAQTQGFENIYNIQNQANIEKEVVGFQVAPEFYTHVPFIAAISALIVDSNYVSSFIRWTIVLLIFNALSSFFFIKTIRITDFKKEEIIFLAAGIFLFFPIFTAFMNGQDDGILLLGLAIWLWGLFTDKPFIAGLGLSLTTVRPQTALFLAFPFLLRHRKVLWGFALGGALLVLISWVLIKTDGMLRFIDSLQFIESTIWVQPHTLDMPTISGIIRRSFKVIDVTLARNLVWGCYVAGMTSFCIVWYRAKTITEKHIGLLALFSILLVPYAHYHDLVILLVPIVCLIRLLSSSKMVNMSILPIIPLIASLIAIAGFAGAGYFKFPLIYLIMLILGTLLSFPDKVIRPPA